MELLKELGRSGSRSGNRDRRQGLWGRRKFELLQRNRDPKCEQAEFGGDPQETEDPGELQQQQGRGDVCVQSRVHGHRKEVPESEQT